MSPTEYPGVIIDGATPRGDIDRCRVLYRYLICLPGVVMTDKVEALDPDSPDMIGAVDWPDVEDQIIDTINGALPDEYVCTVGEVDPGDVIVREVGHPDDETERMV